MLTYFLKRLLFFIPTLLVISLLAFIISSLAPFSPESNICQWPPPPGQTNTLEDCKKLEAKLRKKFNRHLPLFYFRIGSLAEPDTFYRFYKPKERNTLSRLLHRSGNWSAVEAWYHALKKLEGAHDQILGKPEFKGSINGDIQASISKTRLLLRTGKTEKIRQALDDLDKLHAGKPHFVPLLPTVKICKQRFAEMQTQQQSWKSYLPWLFFYPKNQYHCWLKGLVLHFDLGKSYRGSYESVTSRIRDRLFWTAIITLLSVTLAYLISIPMGIMAAARRNSRFDRLSGIFVLALDSLPSFFVATLLIVLFANPSPYTFDWFYASFNQIPGVDESQWEVFVREFRRLILPLIAYTYGALAFLSRTMRISMLEILQQDYIRTAYAKGLPEWKVLTRHGLKNALLPIITVFASIFPALIGGSVILEEIFMIPGMGWETFRAMELNDYPMIIAVFTMTGLLTVTGYLVADILYAWVDPRIRYKS